MNRLLIGIGIALMLMASACNNKNSDNTDFLNGEAEEEYTHTLPEDFDPELFIYKYDMEEYTTKPVDAKTLMDMGFTFSHKGKTLELTGTDPETYDKVPTYTYVYKGIEVTLTTDGYVVEIDFPNEDTLNQFTYILARGYPTDIYDGGSLYSLPGMLSIFVDDDLVLHFNVRP